MNKEASSDDWTRHWGMSSDLGLNVDSVEVAAYTSQERFEAEREKIFRKCWIPVAREAEVRNPGDFIKRNIYPLQAEALITRDKDGQLRAFHNTCLHRGSTIVSECSGNAKSFVCPYHAWTFAIDGKLKGIPGREYFPNATPGQDRLKPIHLDTWNGFIFLNFDDQPRATLAEYLGDFASFFDGLPVDDYGHMIELTMDLDTNWKSSMEASHEGYHVSCLHQKTLSGQMTTGENPLNNLYDPIFSRPHATTTLQANMDWRPDQPVTRFIYETEAFRSQLEGGLGDAGKNEGPTLFPAHKAVNRIDLPAMASEVLLLFPFTSLQMLVNRYVWFQYWPISAGKTRFVMRLYTQSAPSSYREAFAEAHMAAYTRDIATEDGCMMAMQYRGFKSGGISQVQFGENECLLRYFHEMIETALAE